MTEVLSWECLDEDLSSQKFQGSIDPGIEIIDIHLNSSSYMKDLYEKFSTSKTF